MARIGAVDPARPDEVRELAGEDVLGAIAFGGIAERASASTHVIQARDAETLALPEPWELLVPVDAPEVWAAGVTYERSREARVEESQVEDVYSRVYDAERPELFLKDAAGRRTAGPGGAVGIRSDARWSVPEPELALVLGESGAVVGLTIGNDVTARDVEAENPLYLPQAKLFAGACALGPAVLVPDDLEAPFRVDVRIASANGATVFEGATSTARLRRSFAELAEFLLRDNPVPPGSVLLTGTGIVPPDEVALQPGQVIYTRIGGIGTLVNTVAPAADLIERKDLSHDR